MRRPVSALLAGDQAKQQLPAYLSGLPGERNEERVDAPDRIERLWKLMYATMRVRGQTGGFMLDAISV